MDVDADAHCDDIDARNPLRIRTVLSGQTARIAWLVLRERSGQQVRYFLVSLTSSVEAMAHIRRNRHELAEAIVGWAKRRGHGSSVRFVSTPLKPVIQLTTETYYVWKEVVIIP